MVFSLRLTGEPALRLSIWLRRKRIALAEGYLDDFYDQGHIVGVRVAEEMLFELERGLRQLEQTLQSRNFHE